MKRLWSSLRVRLFVGSIAWTVGLLYLAHLLSFLVMFGPRALPGRTSLVVGLPVALASMLAGVLVVHRALKTFSDLRRRLADVHHGKEGVVKGEFLSEVQPVVDDLNRLLQHREERVREALSKAGDLAHGLKTPLAVLACEADRLRAAGDDDLAASLTQQIARMRRHVEYHLAHARAAASGAAPGARCVLAQSVGGILRTMARVHALRRLSLESDIADSHVVGAERADMDEMLGNLVDNACKWARARIVISSVASNGRIEILVDDDGPGIDGHLRAAVLRRGVRADEAAPGSGFGLAIVRDLAELHGGSVALEDSPLGGLRARLELPAR